MLIDLLPTMMMTFHRSFRNDEERRKAAEAWADDLMEVEPERLAECFAAAKSRHAGLSDDAIRFPIVAAEVVHCWRELLSTERTQELVRAKETCEACDGKLWFTSYDPVAKKEVEVRCPYHE